MPALYPGGRMPDSSATLRAGAARAVVTPPLGVSLAGSYHDRRAVGLHDDLYARAFVVDDGHTQLAVVSCDLIGVRASTVAGARRIVQERCGIPPDNVLIAATHNHSGPLTRELGAGGMVGENDEPYLTLLERQIASAVESALSRCAPARLRLTLGEERGVAFNRRFFMRDGPVRTNPGKGNPDIVEPAGPFDPRLWTLTALPAGESIPTEASAAVPPSVPPLALLVNFGLHPAIVAGTIIGADFPAYLEVGVQRLLGSTGTTYTATAQTAATHAATTSLAGASTPGATVPDASLTSPSLAGSPPVASDAPVVVFANAPCGDVNHVDVSHTQRAGGFPEAARIGTILAAEAVKGACRLVAEWDTAALPQPGPPSDHPAHGSPDAASQHVRPLRLRAARRQVHLPLRRPTPDQIAWARDAATSRMSMTPGKGLEVVEAHRILALADSAGWQGDTKTTEVQALAIGDELAIVGLPGEIFAELGLSLRERSPFRHTLVLGLANEAIGYVPTRRAYDEGGYEPTSSRLQPGAGEQLVDEALTLLTSLHDDSSTPTG